MKIAQIQSAFENRLRTGLV